MSAKRFNEGHENLREIRFSGELLPGWAQLLDLAAHLSSIPEDSRHWFSRLTRCSGVDDSRTILEHCTLLRTSIQVDRDLIEAELQNRGHLQPSQILAAWVYALDTMIQEAGNNRTCAWIVEGTENIVMDDSDGGDITLRRV